VTAARAALKIFGGVDSLLGFFGALGRHREPPAASTAAAAIAGASPRTEAVKGTGIERVVGTYSGEGQDLNVVFWDVE
jgi:hypothetical protein